MVRRPLIGLLLATALPLHAADKADLEQLLQQNQQLELRVLRLERLLESRQLVDMANRLDRLQRDVAEQRGSDEEQAYALEQQKKRLHEIYLDIDRRLAQLERGQAVGDAAPTTGGVGVVAAAEGEGEREAYQKAFDLLRDLRYDQAISAFTDFIKQYPKASYAPLAQYWIGEAHYASRKYELAIAAYEKLIADYPESSKKAEAMLKIGYSQHELKQSDKAAALFEQIVAQYPDSTEADQAKAALKALKGGKE